MAKGARTKDRQTACRPWKIAREKGGMGKIQRGCTAPGKKSANLTALGHEVKKDGGGGEKLKCQKTPTPTKDWWSSGLQWGRRDRKKDKKKKRGKARGKKQT